MIGNLEKAEEQIDVVINDLNPLNGKCEYIKALIYIKMGDPIGACPFLATARDSGFSQAEALLISIVDRKSFLICLFVLELKTYFKYLIVN